MIPRDNQLEHTAKKKTTTTNKQKTKTKTKKPDFFQDGINKLNFIGYSVIAKLQKKAMHIFLP